MYVQVMVFEVPAVQLSALFGKLTVILGCSTLKVAVTVFAASIVTVQLPVPVHAPVQPPNVELPSAVALRFTTVPALYASEQSAPQLIPAGEEVTVPLPLPALLTVKLLGCTAVKLALIVRLPVTFVKV